MTRPARSVSWQMTVVSPLARSTVVNIQVWLPECR